MDIYKKVSQGDKLYQRRQSVHENTNFHQEMKNLYTTFSHIFQTQTVHARKPLSLLLLSFLFSSGTGPEKVREHRSQIFQKRNYFSVGQFLVALVRDTGGDGGGGDDGHGQHDRPLHRLDHGPQRHRQLLHPQAPGAGVGRGLHRKTEVKWRIKH